MRKSTLGLLVLSLVALSSVGGVFAQTGPDLTPLYNEFGILFDELGKDTLSHAQQFGLTMDGTGRAEIGKSLFLSTSAGAVFFPGIGTFRADAVSPFTYLGGLIASLEGRLPAGIATTLYNGTKTSFLDPGLRLSAGLALANGLEFWGHFGMVPQLLGDAVGGIAGIPGIVFNRMNAGGRVRYVLVHDQKGLPAVSIGGGYTFTQFNVGLDDLSALALSGLEFSGFGVGLSGSLSAKTRLHTAGVELAISKKLLFIAPFLKMGAWYQWASYDAGITNLALSLTGPGTPPTVLTVSGYVAPTHQVIHDLSFVVSGGLELVFGKASLILQGSYDTASSTPAASSSLQFRI
jgi:hypothetical protein